MTSLRGIKHLLLRASVLLGVSLNLSAARADENPAPPNPDLVSVYQAFGEKAGLTAIMEDLMINLVSDPRTRPFFADADQKHVKEMLVEQFCVILGGPCTYTGKGMKESHAKLAVNEGAFMALVEDLQKAMDQHHVPFRAQNKLLEKLAPMHREVVNRP